MNVTLHVEQIFRRLPIYHVGVTYSYGPFKKRYDFHPRRTRVGINGKRKDFHIGKTKRNPIEILLHEQGMNKDYFLFAHDCRHYTRELLEYSMDNDIDVVNVLSLHNLYNSEM